MKLLHFLKNYINSNNSLIFNEDFFETQKKDSENSAKTAEKSKDYSASAQEEKSNNKKGGLRAFKKSLNKEAQQIENNTIKLIRNTFAQPTFSVHPFENKRVQPIETGRSMVEILGVMAVIGVLTVGGISGYRFAMDKYRANDITNEVNLRNRDTWAVYQTKDLPEDVDELEEWTEWTQTGFPIHVYPRSNILFDVRVDDVPPRVCKNVLQLPLEGPMFVWTTTDEDCTVDDCTKSIFNGANVAEVCGEEENVSMVFTTSLEAYDASPRENGDEDVRYCVDDGDCYGGCEVCVSYVCTSTCPDTEPICFQGIDDDTGRCVKCGSSKDCGANEACNEKHECIEIPQKCEPGTFRSMGGACIPCTDGSSIIVSDENFEFRISPEEIIQDETSGTAQCTACGNHHLETDPSGTIYCSVGCIKGLSYQLESNGIACMPCKTATGELNVESHQMTRNDTKAREQCEACGLDWYVHYYYTICRGPFSCTADQFLGGATNISDLSCQNCTENKAISLGWISGSNVKDISSKMSRSCTACPKFNLQGKYSLRRIKNGQCWPDCEQPDEASEESQNCTKEGISNDERNKCKRQWQNSDGQCLPWNYKNESNTIGDDEELIDLCKKAGRTVKNGYCIIEKTCDLGYFKGVNGTCYSCTYTNVNGSPTIESDAASGCTANCRKKDGKWSTDADATDTRWVYTNGGGTQYCFIICPSNQWQHTGGSCWNCSDIPSWDGYLGGLGTAYCDDRCPAKTEDGEDNPYQRQMKGGKCLFTHCLPKNGVKEWQNSGGTCRSCSQASGETPLSTEECHWCDNRMHITIDGYGFTHSPTVCALVNPGVSGVCNSVEETELPPHIRSDLVDKAKPYLKTTDYNKSKFRGGDGLCYDCNEQTSIVTTQKQCAVCDERRYISADKTCALGQCDEHNEFLNAGHACIKCSDAFNYDKSKIEAGKSYLCDSCSERQVMTLSSGAQYCVPSGCGNQWQRGGVGKCEACSVAATVAKTEIGSESIYREQCEECDRVAFSETQDGKTVWYCSARRTDAKSFINSSGALTLCTANDGAEGTPITNSEKAKTFCEECSTQPRRVEIRADGVYCVKE